MKPWLVETQKVFNGQRKANVHKRTKKYTSKMEKERCSGGSNPYSWWSHKTYQNRGERTKVLHTISWKFSPTEN